ncbi:hypothetical protein WJX81_001681 [Elliptochloris bilobata]|uniref:Uncharacterized protein n=1 Tax=Elliptochloris bilobata TaxID=381761 RepID=A0AAW1S826_9CHLO
MSCAQPRFYAKQRAMQRRLEQRRQGALAPLQPNASLGPQPRAFMRACCADAALVARLAQTAELPGHSGAVTAASWAEAGELLVTGSEDCRLKVWNLQRLHTAKHGVECTVESGHTSGIYCVRFLPQCSNSQIISCASDRQVRVTDLQRKCQRPFTLKGRVRTLEILDRNHFMAGSEDGTVRQFDLREAPREGGRDDPHDAAVIADQRRERTGQMRGKVGVSSMVVDPQRPHLFITGGSDPLVRLYDRRMAGGAGSSAATAWRAPLVAGYVPTHLKAALLRPRPFGFSSVTVTGVAFCHGGDQLVASYHSEQIYTFATAAHARPAHAFGATADLDSRAGMHQRAQWMWLTAQACRRGS